MKKLNITGNVILDTSATLVSGNVTFKTGTFVGYADFRTISDNQATFILMVDEVLVKANETFDISIHCYDNENNTYALVSENNTYVNIDLCNNMHDQYLLNHDSILNKDLIKLLYSNN